MKHPVRPTRAASTLDEGTVPTEHSDLAEQLVSHRRHSSELDDDSLLSWLSARPRHSVFSDVLAEEDPRLRPGAVTTDDDDAFGAQFALGTGQFDLAAPELAFLRAETPLAEVMARKVVCARPDMDASEVRARLLDRGISGLPVVDHWGRVIGMISKTDLIEHEVTSEPGHKQVSEVMTPLVFTLPQDAAIGRAAALMAYEGIHRIVVTDDRGHLVGLISSLDIARWLGRSAGHPVGLDDQ